MLWLAQATYDVISRSSRKPVYNFVGICNARKLPRESQAKRDLAFEACKKFVNKKITSFLTGDVDDNVLGTTMLHNLITTKRPCIDKYVWSCENRVSKHFVIFLNFPCLIACLLCCFLMSVFLLVLWLGICVEEYVDRITILPSPATLFFPYPQFFV